MAKIKTTEETPSFEVALENLERIVRELEDGQLGLSDSLARYEEGVRNLKLCHAALASAEQKIELLTAVDENGVTTTEPFDPNHEPTKPKGKKRSSRAATQPVESVDDASPTDSGDVDTQRGLF